MKRATHTELQPLLGDASIGLEARMSSGDHHSLRLWLRLLSCSTDIETQIRQRLRGQFGMTLARFDYLAQLHRHPNGLRMNALSRFLMVTGGNVTGLADELEKEGLVERTADPSDRRTSRVSLTRKGRKLFDRLAAEHESWLVAMFGGMPKGDMTQLYDLLGRLRVQLAATPAPPATSPSVTRRRTRRSGAPT